MEWDFWKYREDATSDDIGEEERVVVLCRGPVEGRDPWSVVVRGEVRTGAVAGRTADMDVREFIKREMPVSLLSSRPLRMSNVILDDARCL